MAKIDLSRVNKSYGRLSVVNDLDLSIRDGEFLIMLGPSGCGKTTTLNMIAGLDHPTLGTILFDDNEVTHKPPHSRNVAMVFQSSLLYPHLSLRRNIEASLRHTDIDAGEKHRRIAEAVRMLELGPFLDKLPSQVSGGQRQRAATAKAIVRQPSVFLFDEPLSALDAALRLSLRSELVNLQKKLATTAVFVTHDQVEAMTMGDRIAVMSKGNIEQIGTPNEIYNEPETLFVAGFVGSPPMNLIPGAISGGEFRSGAFAVPVDLPPGNVTLGVRPQHGKICAVDKNGALVLQVYAVEHLGRESVVIGDDGQGIRFRVLVEPSFHATIGERLGVILDQTACLFFDVNGKRVRPIERANY